MLEENVPGERISPRFSTFLHSQFHHKIASANTYSEPGNDDEMSSMELDSYADSTVVRRYSSVLEDTGRKATVIGFTSELGESMTVTVVTAAVAYDCEYTGKTFISVIYNALYFQKMETNQVPPIRMHLSGLDVDEFPKLLSGKPMEKPLCVLPDVGHKSTITA